jgi:DNA-binding transcriptional MocR family regulator
MNIPLDRESSQPLYLQIRDRIRRLIQSGALQPGDRLPSIRSLAKSVGVNKLTVIEAYTVLEGDGSIEARQGAGYFVEKPIPAPTNPSAFAPDQNVIIWEQGKISFFDSCAASIRAHRHPETIDLSSGTPRAEGLDDLQRVTRRIAGRISEELFHYDFPQGQVTLRQRLAKMLVQQGLDVSPDNLIVTSGSMQGLSLALHYYVKSGDWVVVESPTFHGTLAILTDLGARVIGMPMSAEGMNLALLEQYLRSHQPKLIYTISTLHNPTGITTSLDHRRQLLALAQQYNCPILEDNAYEGLNFEPVPAPIKALDRHDLVTYLGTFSKTLSPGLRVGYMVVTGQHYQSMVESKLLRDLHVSTISQEIVSEYLASGNYRRRLNHLRSGNLHNRNAMLRAMERHFPAGVTWTVPKGGLFLWAHLPDGVSVQGIYLDALSRGVLILPGSLFFPDRQGYPALRLTYSLSIEKIEAGIAILGDVLHQHLASQASPAVSLAIGQ